MSFERERVPGLGNPGLSNQQAVKRANDNRTTRGEVGDTAVSHLPSPSQIAARRYLIETTANRLRRTGRPETAEAIEAAARGVIPEPVTKRIAQVTEGTAGAFVSTSPGDPHNWRLFITDMQDHITWWDGEVTG